MATIAHRDIEVLDLSMDRVSTPKDITYLQGRSISAVIQLNWTGINAFNSRAILQISADGENWNDWGGDSGGIILLDSPDSQIWEIVKITAPFIRLDFTANSNTAGTGTLIYRLGK